MIKQCQFDDIRVDLTFKMNSIELSTLNNIFPTEQGVICSLGGIRDFCKSWSWNVAFESTCHQSTPEHQQKSSTYFRV